MRAALSIVKNILLWSYPRGSWQYDLLCILILAFILLTPSDWYHSKPAPQPIGIEQPAPSERSGVITDESNRNENETPEDEKGSAKP
ncbi:MAG: hypothetical protein D6723_00760 [Acidobacteria bacterium]|nr:MAG: hypothetical protein D6723_00760 [Acidobacteriota bacterium]